MQEQILYFFQSVSSPVLDNLFEIITMFGEDLVIISLIAWIYWNLDKNKGFILAFTLITSLVFNNALKIIFRSPRPFQVLSDLKGKRIHTATGYSFPSGHTQGASTFYSSLALLFRKKVFWIFACFIIPAIAFSRVYLAVHWPIDVIASLLLGIFISLILVPRLSIIISDEKKKMKFILILNLSSVAILVVVLICRIVLLKGDLKIEDLIKTTALLNGVSWGFLFEMRNCNFINEARLFKKILRFLLGLAGAFLLMEGLKLIFPDSGLFDYIRYFLTGLWIVFVFPYLSVKVSLFQASS